MNTNTNAANAERDELYRELAEEIAELEYQIGGPVTGSYVDSLLAEAGIDRNDWELWNVEQIERSAPNL